MYSWTVDDVSYVLMLCVCVCIFIYNQDIGDALMMYGIDVTHLSSLAQYNSKLQSMALNKFRSGAAAEKLRKLMIPQQTKLDEELYEASRTGFVS